LFNFFFFFLLIFFFIKKKYNNFLIFLSILYFGIAILLTFDRTPLILLLLSLAVINFFYKKKIFFFQSIITFSILILIIFIYPKANARYANLNNFLNEIKNYREKILLKEQIKVIDSNQKFELLEELHEKHYYSYFSIYVDGISSIIYEKTIFGSGKSTFPERCSYYRKSTDPLAVERGYMYACPRHSHNLFIEIGLGSGVIGLIFFSFFLILKIINLSKICKNFRNKNSHKFFYFILLFTCLIVEVFPFRPYGNIFNTYIGLLFFFKIGTIYGLMKNNILKLK